MNKLWSSGIIFTAINFIAGLGQLAFQVLIARRFSEAKGEFGLANGALGLMSLLSLPLLIATTAVTHYIAHFRAGGNQARLRGLLLGCRKFLFRLTIAGTILAVLLVKPLSVFFNFSRSSLIFAVLLCVIASLWGSFATALCQGMAWFKRLALIGLAGVALRLGFAWFATLERPLAEMAIIATAVAVLANLILLYWRKDLFQHGESESPWDRDFLQYLIAGAACMGGGYCFLSGDIMVAKKYFEGAALDNYAVANKLATALPITVAPLLTVLFTSRSSERTGNVVQEQLKLLALYALGLGCGATGLLLLRDFLTGLLRSPEAATLVWRLALTMIFVGLLQALALWSLASRWLKSAILYGVLGLAYWVTLLTLGKTPERLLAIMPVAAGLAFVVLLILWMLSMKSRPSATVEHA